MTGEKADVRPPCRRNPMNNVTVNQIVRWADEYLDAAEVFVGGLDDLVDYVVAVHGATADLGTAMKAAGVLRSRSVAGSPERW
mgnify:FL=1